MIMHLDLQPAAASDYATVDNLSGCYIYDLSEYTGWACPESGRFAGCDDFFADWRAGTNYPYVLRVDGELAGFAGVAVDAETREFVMQEFFVLRKFRRRGVGQAFAHQLFDHFRGNWMVGQLVANEPAMAFWPRAIQALPAIENYRDTVHDTSWGGFRELRFTLPLEDRFPFREVESLWDAELEVRLIRTIPTDLVRGWLPVYDFEMHVDGRPAGNINLRVGNTPSIVLYAGHIGYGVYPPYRGRHYAERACRLLAPLARAHGLATLWLTTNPDNAASRRTCERLGAKLIQTLPLPEDHDLYRIGEREKCRYRWDISDES